MEEANFLANHIINVQENDIQAIRISDFIDKLYCIWNIIYLGFWHSDLWYLGLTIRAFDQRSPVFC